MHKQAALYCSAIILIAILWGCTSTQTKKATDPASIRKEIRILYDFNKNGQLDKNEANELKQGAWILLYEPHESSSPIDEIFDLNNDGIIDLEEVIIARRDFFREQLTELNNHAPLLAKLMDFSGDYRVDRDEAAFITEYFFFDERLKYPHKVEFQFCERIDRNKDGFVDEHEIMETARQLVDAVCLVP